MMLRTLRPVVVAMLILAAFFLFTLPVVLAVPTTPGMGMPAEIDEEALAWYDPGGNDAPIIRARRRISIPYGIDPEVETETGKLLVVSGHGECPVGETFQLRIKVTQAITPTRVAFGSTEADCNGTDTRWVVEAEAVSAPFISDTAEACGHVRWRNLAGSTTSHDWCEEVQIAGP